MRQHEQGARQGAKRRGKPWRTAVPDLQVRRRPDLVQRDFSAAGRNELWVADFAYLRCWEGLVFFAFVVDPYSHEVVGWQFAAHMRTDLVLDELRMALPMTERVDEVELVHHSNAGSQYTSYDYGQTLDDHQVLASIGSVGDAYDNARLALTLPTRTRDRRIRRLVQAASASTALSATSRRHEYEDVNSRR